MGVTDNKAANRYELQVHGHLAVADYRLEGGKLFITHVEVPGELRGQGIAAQVMDGVIEDAKTRGLGIVPICSYAASYLKRKGL